MLYLPFLLLFFTGMLYSLIYTSRAVAPLDHQAMLTLLTLARTNNCGQHITGVLLHSADHFLQVLEGTREEVDLLFAKIQRDSRHNQLRLLGKGPIRRREFPNWSMGFSQLSYPVFVQLQRFIRHPNPEAEWLSASVKALSLRDLLQPFILHTVVED